MRKIMTVELISVGTEILLGNIVNTNAAWLSEQCARLGLSCYYQSVVGDNAVRLKEQIQQALNRSDIVILTGGLGPTTDDLTKETAAQLMGKGLVMDMHSLERVEAYFKARRIEMTENNKNRRSARRERWCSTTITVQHRTDSGRKRKAYDFVARTSERVASAV